MLLQFSSRCGWGLLALRLSASQPRCCAHCLKKQETSRCLRNALPALFVLCSKDGVGRPWAEGEQRINKLVFIGKNLDRQELTNSFKACLVSQPAA